MDFLHLYSALTQLKQLGHMAAFLVIIYKHPIAYLFSLSFRRLKILFQISLNFNHLKRKLLLYLFLLFLLFSILQY